MSAENDLRIDYVEFPATDLPAVKHFYQSVFGWTFKDYGPEYTSFLDGRLAGGFFRAEQVRTGGPLVVIYARRLNEVKSKVVDAGGKIVRDTFGFPGGCRFHFADPAGNELAVWSEQES